MDDYHDRKSFALRVLRSKIVNWKQGHEDNEHSQRAVDFLIKKLKNTDGVLDSLAKVLLKPHYPSSCITIPQSVDKRIQIVYRKDFPHVVYCRLWRFADLQNYHELVPVPYCRYPFLPGSNPNQKCVCINPYHYNRIPSQVLPSIIEPRINNENAPPTPPPSLYSPDPYSPQWVPHQIQPVWCTINYYEFSSKVGEQFRGTERKIFVDGYTLPYRKVSNRFSLGSLENVKRQSIAEDVRTLIRGGIELILHDNGDVSIRNRSWTHSVFIQSILYNRLNSLKDSTVYHLQSRHSINSIFNLSVFTQLVNNPAATYETILDLTKLCTIQVSFKYGWGYECSRREITLTPCWLSIIINEPLRLIDTRLQQLQPEQATISS
ncbi:unnamed protein product [Rotaria socialis]|uniref:Mothers against decapentaplegic homolog n=2 Tax=Rotaria socialis TaxID=392032 RepID=A0A818E4U7_9BILA|nr:unnamed protein product [Rotaria socialis]CAF3394498.1 unnamed protein product [Rotaria socialis]CAF3443134.1 unnamed protein product [Rotaria socialis]CAF3455536.1 unnamed protein product [Rotaria socialis]CAF3769096.1 unnamed protein product [Rotaria socialis]